MKKTDLILITVVALLTLFIGISILFFSLKKPETNTTPPPIQSFSPSPSPPRFVNVSKELELEKQQQESYAAERENFLKTKPWILKLPFKSESYFISYNPETDSLIVELYYTENTENKEQQISAAKEAALNAMILASVDITKQKIEYLELMKKEAP